MATEVTCESCGEANPARNQFCQLCGAYLDWDPAEREQERDRARAGGRERAPALLPDDVTRRQPRVLVGTDAAPPLAPDAVLDPEPPIVDASPSDSRACPSCRRANPQTLRFCARCGYQLAEVTSTVPLAPAPPRRDSWWQRLLDSEDRAARRAYRRSLPPLYRWRRVLIGALVVALVVAAVVVTRRDPVGWVVDRWYDVRGTVVVVSRVKATVEPADAVVGGSEPGRVTDRGKAALTIAWSPQAQGEKCGGAPGTPVITLTFAPTRIRELRIVAGLPADSAARPLQARPEFIGLAFDDGVCRPFPLDDTADEQRLAVDSAVAVTSVRIGVDSAYPAQADGQALLSFTEIILLARPR